MSKVLPKIGFHVSKSGHKTMAEAIIAGCAAVRAHGMTPAMQIFVTGPYSMRRELSGSELALIAEITESDRGKGSTETPILMIHGAYIDNPWDLTRPHIEGSFHNIRKEMRMAHIIGATGVVVHMGAKCNDSIYDVLGAISRGLADEVKSTVVLYLEINAAKSTDNTFETPAKICDLFSRIDRHLRSSTKPTLKVGLCVDTAHLHSCGATLTTAQSVREWFGALPAVPIIVHLNDSKSVAGSGKDRHEHLGKGNIWGDDRSGLREIIRHCSERSIPMIIERDDPMPDLVTISSIIGDLGSVD